MSYSYWISENHDLLESIDFACSDSIALDYGKAAVPLERDPDQMKGDWDKDAVMRDGSSSSSDSETSKSELSEPLLESQNVLGNDSSMN